MYKVGLDLPKDAKCIICNEKATTYCPYCVDEYDTAPRFVPVSLYCNKHYETVVETGNCCYENERIYGETARGW